ncbi:MAG TPA: carboxypeptidase-like regulatory domain-containing protein [Candidatus Binatia bacterium]|nr:carboxypeptidase-like regulatory domain-containing protein [Candidatus Binatia bacterium]
MPRRPLLILALSLISVVLAAGDKKDEGPQSSTTFVVLKDDSGKPIRNAAVVLHPVGKNGRQMRAGFELKTDAEGRTHFDGIPYGLLRVQVIAHGFQTFGNDFQINQPEQEITVRLKRPQQQYSIYEKHDGTAPPNQKPY